MSLNSSLTLLLASLGTATAALTAVELSEVYTEAAAKAAQVQTKNDAQTLEAARIWYQLQGGPANASEQELVDKGYLKPEFLTRERVMHGTPLPTSE